MGDEISRWLKWQEESDISPLTELFLFNASRSQLVEDVIIPNLEKGGVVICDRFADSTTVYQGYGRGLDITITRTVNSAATRGLIPNLTILLDLPSEEGLDRKKSDKYDRFEREEMTFHEKIRQGYLELAAEEPQRWLVIDAGQDKEKIADIIWHKVSQLLPRRA